MKELKKCVICKWLLPLSDFNLNRSKKDGLQEHCRECNRKHSREYYARHLEKHRRIVMERKDRIRKEVRTRIIGYLRMHPCVDCGESDPIVLQFDHVRGKKIDNISYLATYGASWKKIEAEIAKCEVRCANCHTRKTAREERHLRYELCLETC